MRNTALLLTLLVVAGCTEVRWIKPGAGTDTLGQDLQACRSSAAEKAARMGALGPPSPAYDPRFGAAPGPSQVDLKMQERQVEERCMHDKGYTLVPAER